MNVLNVIGNVGKDAETRFLSDGKSVTNFSVAMESGWGDRKQTTWVNCSMWGERGSKVAQYITKGSKVGVTGEISLREWESNGKSGVSLECNVSNVTLCGDKRQGDSAQPQVSQPQPVVAGGAGDIDDDIPF